MTTEVVVYIVDDDEGVRKALSLLMKTSGYRSRSCASAQEFLDCYDRVTPACLLLDVRMPGMSGMELQQKLAEEDIYAPIIFMTGHADVTMAVKAMKHGAYDFIEKPFSNDELLQRVDVCLGLVRAERDKVTKGSLRGYKLSELSPREHEIALELVNGRLNKQIAATLGISVRTVEVHRANIMRKLQIRTLPELTRLFLS